MYSSLAMAIATIPARNVRAGDTIEFADAMTGATVRREVLGLSFSFVWVNGERVDTVCLAIDPVTGRGPVVGSGDVVAVVVDDAPPAPPADAHPGERAWW